MEVKDYPNYLIYSDARVWSKKSNKFIKHRFNGTGYHQVVLYNPKRKCLFVHRLVAGHYILNPDNKPEVDHIDRDIDNNDLSNLRWATRSENRQNQRSPRMSRLNKSGHKNIFFRKNRGSWVYQRNNPYVKRSFKTKTDAICFKFICLLKRSL